MIMKLFGRKISRQKIYPSRLLSSFYLSKIKSRVDESAQIISDWINRLVGLQPLFLGRARVGLYLASDIINNERPGVCLLSPLTILDVANMLAASGASLEYYDLRKNLFECDVDLLEARISCGDVSSLVVTHYFYIQRDFDRILDICARNNVSIIEDCAISLGATYKGLYSGSFGRFGVYSFSLFKFLNNFWGGAIVCKYDSDYQKIQSKIETWPSLSYHEYFPQAIKYVKFGAVTFQPIFKFVFHVFSFGLRNNIKFITNNIQNDPFVNYNMVVPNNCFTLPHASFFVELSRKCHSVFSQRDMRQQKAKYVYDNVDIKSVFALPAALDFNASTFISLPLIFSNARIRDHVAMLLLAAGIDCSKQLYRNISTVNGFDTIKGDVFEVQNLIDCCLYIPLHKDVNFDSLNKIVYILNGLEI